MSSLSTLMRDIERAQVIKTEALCIMPGQREACTTRLGKELFLILRDANIYRISATELETALRAYARLPPYIDVEGERNSV